MSLPVTVLSGYLGAGKTTLVNRILRAAEGRRLAVMVNEFGDLPIDADLIEAEGDDLVALAGGCVCCSYGDDLMAALVRMAALDPAPDHVILEASGVALPGAIAASLSLVQGIETAGVVVLADLSQIARQLADDYIGDTVERQLAAADLVVLTKADLVEDATGPTALVMQHAGRAAVATGTPDIDAILHPARVARPTAERHGNAVGLTRRVETPAPQDAESYARALAGVAEVIRAKGHLETPDGMRTVQIVGDSYAVTAAPAGAVAGVVVIARVSP